MLYVVWVGVHQRFCGDSLRGVGEPMVATTRVVRAHAADLRRTVDGLARQVRGRSRGGRGLAEPLSDERTRAVVLRARAGDPGALGELFESHEAAVLRICSRMLGGGADPHDARSEIFLRAQRALPTYDLERPFPPWLFRIAGNHCIDLLRQRAAEHRVFADIDLTDEDAETASDPGRVPSALARLVLREQASAVDQALADLPLKYRLPLILRYFGDDDYATIAETLGVTTGQVGSLLHRAKRLLRERVVEQSEGHR